MQIESAFLPWGSDPVWPANFKRSISSLLQVDLRQKSAGGSKNGPSLSNQIYTDSEVYITVFLKK